MPSNACHRALRGATCFAFAALLVVLVGQAPVAAAPPVDVDAGRALDDTSPTVQLVGDVAISGLSDDLFVQLTAAATLAYDGWRFGLRAPLRLRIADDPPPDHGILRDQDWDEIGDYARLVPLIGYGRDGELVHFSVGEVPDLTLGFGALVDRYSNTIDVDHYQTGIYASVNHPRVGGQLFVDDAFNPGVGAARVWLRPLGWLDVIPWPLADLQIGVTAGADFRAPVAVAAGKALPIAADHTRQPLVISERALPLFGVDLSLPIDLPGMPVRLTPYIEVASLDFASGAFHLGLAAAWQIDTLSQLHARAEYRYHSSRHAPGYVSTFYDIERLSFAPGRTKLGYLAERARAGHGVLVEASLHLPPWVTVGAQVAYDTAYGTDVRADLTLPSLGPVELRATLALLDIGATSVDGLEQSITEAHRLGAAAQVRVQILDWLYLRGAIKSQWRLTDIVPGSEGAALEGRYATGVDYDVGLTVQSQL